MGYFLKFFSSFLTILSYNRLLRRIRSFVRRQATIQAIMDPHKSRVTELEDAKSSPLDRHGDLAHQQKLTRKVLWKLDIQSVQALQSVIRLLIVSSILPILALLFLMSFLDRTNVGNAKIIGLEADLSITDHQYDVGLAVFYLTYICRCVISHRIFAPEAN